MQTRSERIEAAARKFCAIGAETNWTPFIYENDGTIDVTLSQEYGDAIRELRAALAEGSGPCHGERPICGHLECRECTEYAADAVRKYPGEEETDDEERDIPHRDVGISRPAVSVRVAREALASARLDEETLCSTCNGAGQVTEGTGQAGEYGEEITRDWPCPDCCDHKPKLVTNEDCDPVWRCARCGAWCPEPQP